jgi:hypothetical protein
MSLLTIWGWQHSSVSGGSSRRRRLFDAMGNCQLSGKPRGLVQATFDFTGRISGIPDDVSRPSAPAALGSDPQTLQAANAYWGGGSGASTKKVKFTDWTLDFGCNVVQFDDVSDSFGYDSAEIIERMSKGSMALNLQDTATRDNFSDAAAMNNKPMWIQWGSVANGNGISVYHPQVRINNITPDNGGGWQTEKVEYDCNGLDAETYICVF